MGAAAFSPSLARAVCCSADFSASACSLAEDSSPEEPSSQPRLLGHPPAASGGGERCVALSSEQHPRPAQFSRSGLNTDIVLQLARFIGQVDDFLLQPIDGSEPGNGLPGDTDLAVRSVSSFCFVSGLPNLLFLLRLKNHDTCRFSLERPSFSCSRWRSWTRMDIWL